MTPELLDTYATMAALTYVIPALTIGFAAYCCFAAYHK